MVDAKIQDKRRRAGRLGGIQTYLRHGRGHYVSMGKKGGRPRLPGYAELLEMGKNKNERRQSTEYKPTELKRLSLCALRKLWRATRGESFRIRIPEREVKQQSIKTEQMVTVPVAVEGNGVEFKGEETPLPSFYFIVEAKNDNGKP